MLDEEEVRDLKQTAMALSAALESGLNQVCDAIEEETGKCSQNTDFTPRQALLRAYATAAVAVRGDQVTKEVIENEILRIEEHASLGDTGIDVFVEGVPNLERIFTGALPIQVDGLLGLTVEEALNKDIRWLAAQKVRFRGIQLGLENVLHKTLAISENPVNVHRQGSTTKIGLWWHPINLLTPEIRVAYIPVGYIP